MAAEAIIEEVAENLEEAAELTRKIDTRGIGFFLGGVGVGVALGFFFGYRFNREKIKAEAFAQSESEVEMLRDVYKAREIAREQKPALEEVVEEMGYSLRVPEQSERPLPAPVPITTYPDARDTSNVENERPSVPPPVDPDPAPRPDWIYAKELEARSSEYPYIIHEDEYRESELDYAQVSYTYYAADDVLVGEDDRPITHPDLTVGQNNLRFGHGSEDPNIVFVRNDRLELEMEICRSPGSYEQEILGLEHSETHEKTRRPNRFDRDESS